MNQPGSSGDPLLVYQSEQESSRFDLSDVADKIGTVLGKRFGKNGSEAIAEMMVDDLIRVRKENEDGERPERLILDYHRLVTNVLGSRQELDLDEQIAKMSDEDKHSVLLRAAIEEFNRNPQFQVMMIEALSHAQPEMFRKAIGRCLDDADAAGFLEGSHS